MFLWLINADDDVRVRDKCAKFCLKFSTAAKEFQKSQTGELFFDSQCIITDM